LSYTHGVYIQENNTSVTTPVTADSANQFIVGTAPINLLDDPSSAVNVPILVEKYSEAVEYLGYSSDWESYTLCQSMYASFKVFNVSPLIFVNVLDPDKHYTSVASESNTISSGAITIEKEGILINANFVVQSSDGATTYTEDTDYTLAFDDDGYVVLTVLSAGSIGSATELLLSYRKLDPSAVDKDDIIGSYSSTTGKYTGLENISQVYPKLGLLPGLILAPGWSHIPSVGIAMTAACESINGIYNCNCILDVDTSEVVEYSAAYAWKNSNSYNDKHALVCWPKVVVDDYTFYMSAMLAALVAYTDYENDGVPYVSPSNKDFNITGTVLADGTEIYLDQAQGNTLNGKGIITALNLNGWVCWGNNTGVYPTSTDVKDRWIPVRRMFDWWGNTFILTYFQKVDSAMNRRLIDTIIDTENIRANGYKAKYQLADARIEFVSDDNPTTDLIDGKITFHQYLTPFPPAETIINVLEYDADALTTALEESDS